MNEEVVSFPVVAEPHSLCSRNERGDSTAFSLEKSLTIWTRMRALSAIFPSLPCVDKIFAWPNVLSYSRSVGSNPGHFGGFLWHSYLFEIGLGHWWKWYRVEKYKGVKNFLRSSADTFTWTHCFKVKVSLCWLSGLVSETVLKAVVLISQMSIVLGKAIKARLLTMVVGSGTSTSCQRWILEGQIDECLGTCAMTAFGFDNGLVVGAWSIVDCRLRRPV